MTTRHDSTPAPSRQGLAGVLVVDKPAGPTSHDVVDRVRRALGVDRVGHTGTLDPAATGVLALVIGRATRLARFLAAGDKEYRADIRLGVTTDTYDAAGAVVRRSCPAAWPPAGQLEEALAAFHGAGLQTPPPYSAKKVGGERAYRLARRQSPAALAPVPVTVSRLTLLAAEADRVTITLICSAGFYVRSLAHELGERLGCGACLAGLRRLRSGEFTLDMAADIDTVEREGAGAASRVIPPGRLLGWMPAVRLTEGGAARVSHGHAPADADLAGPLKNLRGLEAIRLLDPRGELVAIARPGGDGVLRPVIVLV
jgi:tRNA pseudouridine55 synthase